MAITWPAEARIVDSALWLEQPGRRDSESPYSGEIHRIEYGGARWRGILAVGPFGRPDTKEHELGQAFEAFLVKWIAGKEPAELPHGRPDFGDVIVGSPTVSWSGGIATVSRALSDTKPGGTMIRFGDRLYMCTEAQSTTKLEVAPNIDPGSGAAVGTGATVLAMPDGDIELGMVADTYGPWTIPWVEWLG